MATTEHTINDALAEALRKTRRAWRKPKVVRSENTGMLRGSAARPDIVVLEANVSPVVIETELLPAATVEQEAISRLGQGIRATNRTILSAIAVRLPARLRQYQGVQLQQELADALDLEMVLFTGSSPTKFTRWPQSGWLSGGVADLSSFTQLLSIPPEVIDEAADNLVTGISQAATLLGEMADDYPGAIERIALELRQEDSEQTRRMAATVLTNAFIFHGILAGSQDELKEVKSIQELRETPVWGLGVTDVLTEWRKILSVNYWPIFDIARRILVKVPAVHSKFFIHRLAANADQFAQNHLMRSHDLTGAVFQRLIADRKFLAAYYTTPASAALLIGLAVTPDILPEGKSWANAEDIRSLRVADFACGTGTLLSTAYHRMSHLHEIAGGDAEKLHPYMMSDVMVGCDVLPAAAHLTASTLAGAHPMVKYSHSSILTVAYGRQPDGAIALGSLDLLDPQGTFEILTITAKAAEGMGEAEQETWRTLPHASFDIVIMNPPFTRATVHHGKSLDIPNPMFAAFGSSDNDQRKMADKTKSLIQGTSAHGNAGEASIFLVLADRKLKLNGVLALVMPLSLMSGESWEESRRMLAKNYSDLTFVSIAGTKDMDMSFSADTNMGECLITGRKSESGSSRGTFIVLNERPAYPLVGTTVAEQIKRLIANKQIRQLEDGPMGGTPLYFGNDMIGQVLNGPLPPSGAWNLSRISDLSLAQTAYQLVNEKRVWLPATTKSDSVGIPITTVADIGSIGPIHRDINGVNPDGAIRGPFDVHPVGANSVPTYPILWAHNADNERTILFAGDSEGLPRRGATVIEKSIIDGKVASVWRTASHCHFNCDFRFNSQSTGMQFTPRKTIGGRAWLSIQLAAVEQEKALVLWGNTTLGLLLRWWHSNRQQSGRGSIGKQALHTMPVLDVTALSSEQMATAVKLFDEMSGKELLPMHEIDKDPVRKELDAQFGRLVLGLPEALLADGGPLDILRMKLSREPSVRGAK